VAFSLERSGGALNRARFQAKDVSLACEDAFRRSDLGPVNLRFSTARSFEGSRYTVDSNGTERYFKVRGELISGDRARGYLYFFEDPVDSPPAGALYEPDCGTSGERYGWRARRVR
jgi:hypothetical protein